MKHTHTRKHIHTTHKITIPAYVNICNVYNFDHHLQRDGCTTIDFYLKEDQIPSGACDQTRQEKKRETKDGLTLA